jgi:phospholipid transport system substrate-binding protein
MLKLRYARRSCCLISAVFCLCAMFYGAFGNAAQSGPSAAITKFNAALIESMQRAKELGYPGRYKLLEPVIKDSFALSYMAGISVGKTW